MYDELVKSLRQCITDGGGCGNCKELKIDWRRFPKCWHTLFSQAADAIEELSKYANNINRLKCEGWHLQQSKYHDGYQAIATMLLPEPPKEVE